MYGTNSRAIHGIHKPPMITPMRLCAQTIRNARLCIDYSPQYLERFFRNLLLGEQWDLRSRYLYINPPEEWQNQPNLAAEQVQNKYRTSTEQVPLQVPPQVCRK